MNTARKQTGASEVVVVVKHLPANAGDTGDAGLIPGLGRSSGGDGNPLQYSCLENPLDRGAWWATVHGAAKSWTCRKQLSMYKQTKNLQKLIQVTLEISRSQPSFSYPTWKKLLLKFAVFRF